MASNRIALQNANMTVADFAKYAGVRRTAVADYLSCRWKKCGSENRKKIHAALHRLGIAKQRDPKQLARQRMRQFHRDANDLALYLRMVGQSCAPDVPDAFLSSRFCEVR